MEMFKCFRKRTSLRGCSEKNQCDPGDIYQQSASRHLQEHIENLTTKVITLWNQVTKKVSYESYE